MDAVSFAHSSFSFKESQASHVLLHLFQTNGHLPGNGEVYQERLARLENDKESLVLQASDFKMLFFLRDIFTKTILSGDGIFRCFQEPDC